MRFYQITIIILVCLVLLLGFKSCDQKTSYIIPDTSTLKKRILKVHREAIRAERKAAISHTIAVKGRDRWHKVKDRIIVKDSLIRRDSVVYLAQECDTAISKYSIALADKDTVILKYKNLNLLKDSLHAADSTAIRELKREVRRQKWQKRGIIAAWILREGAGVVRD